MAIATEHKASEPNILLMHEEKIEVCSQAEEGSRHMV